MEKSIDEVDPASAITGLDALTAQLDEGLVVVTTDGLVAYLNPAARRLFGGRAGMAFAAIAGDYRLARMVEQARSSGVLQERELGDSGGGLEIMARALRTDTEGTVTLTVHDRSELRRLERVRRDFVGNVSHELRTPVTAIQLLVETLQAGALDEPAAAREFVGRIRLEVTHMAQMVEQLLDLSTIESGEAALPRDRVALSELLRAADRLRPLAEERNITLEVVPPVAPGYISGDATRLGHVLRNLVHNAIKFTPPAGSVTVRCRTDQGDIVFEVSDTGVGIAPEELPRIFERFWKADRSRQRDGEGSGLGLAIARHVVDVHGGTISVRSAPGAGSTFTVRLPPAPPDQPA
ncbi:MAG: hypothetical protein NVSMB29_02880 [Candidatus Dormibacteria bacterium]